VAVVGRLDTGRVQVGSGYLISEGRVLTALHCIADKKTGRPARSLRVVRLSDGAEAAAEHAADASQGDAALLAVAEIPVRSEPPQFARVDRSRTKELRDCQAVGFPLWQLDPQDMQRNAAELHGTIRLTEDIESGLLVMRDPLLADVAIPRSTAAEDRAAGSPWGGLSGALVFHEGTALGIVIEHHPRKGRSAITIQPTQSFAVLLKMLGLPPSDELPLVGAPSLGDLVEVLAHSRLPRVDELDPYRLGVTASAFGNADTYGQHDQYVCRIADEQLAMALRPGRLVIVVGPSKVGKTRTAFEALRIHDDWSHAFLATPVARPRSALERLAGHIISGRDPLVIWLDDLHRFLPPSGKLSQATVSRLLDRPGPTVLLATLRSEQRERLRSDEGQLSREVRVVFDNATSIQLGSTRDDLGEQARASGAYPLLRSQSEGLAEVLAGAPELLRRYRDAAANDPLLYALVETGVDWSRCGLLRPIPESDLLVIAGETLEERRADLDADNDQLVKALREARKGMAAGGQVALLRSYRLPDGTRGYEAFDYLVAADDGQGNERVRPVAEATWRRFLDLATDEDATSIGYAAFDRRNIPIAVVGLRRAARAGDIQAQANLGVIPLMLDPPDDEEARTWATKAAQAGDSEGRYGLGILLLRLDPPDLEGARNWWTQAARADHTLAQFALGGLLLDRLDPPELLEAHMWWTRAAQAGLPAAQYKLGMLMAERFDPPDLEGARTWYTRAAEAGMTDAQFALGLLLYQRLNPPRVAEARIWWTRAAEAGDTDAQFSLGVLAERLDPPDLAAARTWYTQAAEAEHIDAQVNLGALLSARLDPPDLVGARTWWTRAAQAGVTDAQSNLAMLLAEWLDPPELAEARSWYTRAAKAGDIDSQVKLAFLLGDRLDPPDLAEAHIWATRAAQAGHHGAQLYLGLLLAERLDPPDLKAARIWYTQAAEAGYIPAQVYLGVLLAKQLDPPEPEAARAWWTRAAEAGDIEAQYNLGVLAEQLDPPDVEAARTWYSQAAQEGHIDARTALSRLEGT
jgi:TPR repeat protein